MPTTYTPIRTALNEAYFGDTALARLLFADPSTFDARVISLLSGLGLNVDTPANTAITTADIKALFASLHATDNAQRIAKLASYSSDIAALSKRIDIANFRAKRFSLGLMHRPNPSGQPLDYDLIGPQAVLTSGFNVTSVICSDVDGDPQNFILAHSRKIDSAIPSGIASYSYAAHPFVQAYADAMPLPAYGSLTPPSCGAYIAALSSFRRLRIYSPNSGTDIRFTVELPYNDSANGDDDIEFEVTLSSNSAVPRSFVMCLTGLSSTTQRVALLVDFLGRIATSGGSVYMPYLVRLHRVYSDPFTFEWRVSVGPTGVFND